MPASTTLKCPRDVLPDHYAEMMRLAPKGARLLKSRRHLWWREFTFLIEGKPSRVSKLKQGDHFTMSCATKIQAR